MARFTRMQVLNAMAETGLIPVFYNHDLKTSKEIIGACAEGGAKCIQIVNRGDTAIDVYKDLETFCMKMHPQIILGTGAIVDAPTAAMYIAYGCNFITGPVLDKETAMLCNKRKIPYTPGCGSVSEIHQAHLLGVEICSIFPSGQVGGPSFVKALKGPCPWASIMPAGGVAPTRKSLTEWFQAGITCASMGSKLITRILVKRGDYNAISSNLKSALAIIKEVKKKMGN